MEFKRDDFHELLKKCSGVFSSFEKILRLMHSIDAILDAGKDSYIRLTIVEIVPQSLDEVAFKALAEVARDLMVKEKSNTDQEEVIKSWCYFWNIEHPVFSH